MEFKKIPKEEWFKMSQDERDYHTLEFQKSVEKRQRKTILITRLLALCLICGLFFMGYVQLQQIKVYDEKIEEYGSYAFCALCGEYNFKKCECQYYTEYDYGNIPPGEINKTEIGEYLAEYNMQQCGSYDSYKRKSFEDLLNSTENYSIPQLPPLPR